MIHNDYIVKLITLDSNPVLITLHTLFSTIDQDYPSDSIQDVTFNVDGNSLLSSTWHNHGK